MSNLLLKGYVSISDVSDYPDDKTIINKENDWDDDPYNMFDDPFED